MSQIVESYLRSLTADVVTDRFLILIFFCFVFALFAAWKGKVPRFTAHTPTLLTSLGILGTFVGIVIGLLNFDPAQLDESIGKLLDGLKTAFITSITGMALGILFKVLSTTPWLRSSETEPELEIGPADILAKLDEQTRLLAATRDAVAGDEESSLAGQMKLLRTDLADQHRDDRQTFDELVQKLMVWQDYYREQLAQLYALYEKSAQSIANIAESSSSIPDSMEKLTGVVETKLDEQTRLLAATRDAVAGAEESSLAGQMKLLRTDLADQHRDDRQAFDAFADHLREQLKEVAQMLSKAATEQIVDALRQVIVDFNEKITEQFGDNFQRLDDSVQKLVEWQEHYREQLAQLHALYDQSVQSITKIDASVAHIAESSSSIPASMEKLADIVETARHQLADLERHLDAFVQMRDRAVEAVPQMQAHVEETTRTVAASVDTASEHYKELLANSDSYIQAQDEKAHELLKTFTDAGERIQRDLQAEHLQLLQGLDVYTKEQDKMMRETLAIFTDVSERIQRNTQTVQQEVADSIQQMQSQLETSVNEVLGAQNQAIGQGVERLHEHMRQSASRTGEAVNAQLEALDQLMNQEIERVMNEMGGALAQIAGKFTEDYRELTEAMGRIVERGGGRFR